MKEGPRFWYILVASVVLVVGNFIAVENGWYLGEKWVDIPLHIIGGLLLGLLWWWILYNTNMAKNIGSRLVVIASFLGFASIGNYVWELYEYLSWQYLAEALPAWELYSPTVGDVLSDMILATFGALVISLFYIKSTRSVRK